MCDTTGQRPSYRTFMKINSAARRSIRPIGLMRHLRAMVGCAQAELGGVTGAGSAGSAACRGGGADMMKR
jgi:hypothetical protein